MLENDIDTIGEYEVNVYTTELSTNSYFFNGVFMTLLNIYDRTFCENRSRRKINDYFQKKIYHRCLTKF